VTAGVRRRDLFPHVLAQLREAEATGDAVLGDALDPHDRRRASGGQLAHPLPARSLAGRREAVVDEEPLDAGGAQELGGVGARIGGAAVRVDRVLRGRAAQQRGELAHGPGVRDARRDVRPLARVGALREQPAELVERRRRPQDPVRVVVDERDLAQYFRK
jgi:hypothetical protein